MNILIIEDDKDLCHAVSWQLEQEGHRVDCCHDGGEATLYIRQGIYDLILLDCMLPLFFRTTRSAIPLQPFRWRYAVPLLPAPC